MTRLRTVLLLGALGLSPAWSDMARAEIKKAPKKTVAPLAAGRALDRWEKMTPEQRQRALDRMPPERRAQMEERLNRLEQLPPEQKEQLKQRYREFQALPRDRQDAVRLEIQALRSMRPAARIARVNSPAFQRQYSPDEQKILKQSLGIE
jgi:hypothetical protein